MLGYEPWLFGDPPRCNTCDLFMSRPHKDGNYACRFPTCPASDRYVGPIQLTQVIVRQRSPSDVFGDLVRAIHEQLKSFKLWQQLFGAAIGRETYASERDLRESFEYRNGGAITQAGIELLIQHPSVFKPGEVNEEGLKTFCVNTFSAHLLEHEKAPDPSNPVNALNAIESALAKGDKSAVFQAYLVYLAGRVAGVYEGTELNEPWLQDARKRHGMDTLPFLELSDAPLSDY